MTKKLNLDEHIKRIKNITGYDSKKGLIKEDIDTDIDPNFEREMTAAMDQLVKDLPAEIQDFTSKDGNHDDQLEPAENGKILTTEEINEAVGSIIAGTALALPQITNLVGKGLSALGKKIDAEGLKKAGEVTQHFAHEWHGKYLSIIEKVISPFTKNVEDPEKKKLIAKGVLLCLTLVLGASAVSGAVHAAGAGEAGVATIESGLGSVKAGEIITAAKEILPRMFGISFD